MAEYPIPPGTTSLNHCIYIHVNKITGQVYIGQATGDPKLRWGSNGSNYRKQPCFWGAIQEFGWNNFEHHILEDHLSEDQANEREKYWISFYQANKDGYNRTGGGKGSYNLSPDAAERKAKNMAKYWASAEGKAQAKKHSEEISGINNPMYGKHHTEATKKRISESRLGEKNVNWQKTGIKNHLSKPVYCIELDRFFGSAAEADRFLGCSAGFVSKCCHNGKTAKGYHWRYGTLEEVSKMRGAIV